MVLNICSKESHIPPERIFEAHSLDFRNDIWSLGVLLTELAIDGNFARMRSSNKYIVNKAEV